MKIRQTNIHVLNTLPEHKLYEFQKFLKLKLLLTINNDKT